MLPEVEPQPPAEHDPQPAPFVDLTPESPGSDADAPAVLGHAAGEIRRVVAELARRKVEALRLYEPLPEQARFHGSAARQRLLRGSNRGGKTLPAAVEVARAVTGQDPHGKYPAEGGRCFCVGKNLDHVGQVMWRKLGRAGAFKMIRDLATGRWRAYRPWEAADKAREREAKPAPPLVPPRMVKAVAWENKAKGIPKQVTLHNGWEINFYSSEGKPPQGSDIDLWWFDEEIVDPEWYPEMVARLLDRAGRGVWSATPQAGTEQLLELHERAELQRDYPEPDVEEFVILLDDNPHIGQKEKDDFATSLSEEQRQVRVGGEFVIHSYRVFPEFSLTTHGVGAFAVPHHWTRYAVIDPGRQVCAVLFAAVPPPEEGDFVYLYDELYLQNADAEQFGQRMGRKAVGQSFEAFVIDHHGGRVTEMGSGWTVERQYSRALQKNKVRSRKTGFGFVWGCDDVAAGVEAFRSWLQIREDGTTKLRVLRGKLPNFEWEIRHFRYKRVGGLVTDKPEERGRVHQMANCRYLAMYHPRWVRSKGVGKRLDPVLQALKDKRERVRRKEGGTGGVNLGPGRRTRL